MYLSHIKINNFRAFKEFELDLQQGLNLIVGENNSGKTALIDAIRLILGTRDNERIWLDKKDFYYPTEINKEKNGQVEKIIDHSDNLIIECIFRGFKDNEASPFLEWIGFDKKNNEYFLKLKLVAKRNENESTKFGKRITVDITAGPDSKGTQMDGLARDLLRATYLKPLRDAEQELKSKRGSRLSQILLSHPNTNINTEEGKKEKNRIEELIKNLNTEIVASESVYKVREDELNTKYFNEFLFEGQDLLASISMVNPDFKDILEKLELNIDKNKPQGLGINNLLFMATELLLLKPENDEYDLPLLLIEEPEAHIHPQYQLNLINYFENQKDVQVLMTTHSSNLTSKVDIERLIIIKDANSFPMGHKHTCLEKSDYEFLRRFLDVTKANMFFAKGIILVEGYSECILLPIIAELINKPLHKYGVSIVNVGHTGLFRYSRIFMRKPKHGNMDIKVACITDLDIPPNAALTLTDYLKNTTAKDRCAKNNEKELEILKKKYRSMGISRENEKDLHPDKLTQEERIFFTCFEKYENIETFISPQWTLEFDIANSEKGFYKELYTAILLANSEVQDKYEKKKAIAETNIKSWEEEFKDNPNKQEIIACKIYERLYKGNASKPEAAQYFVELIKEKKKNITEEIARKSFPEYLIKAIDFVTTKATEQKYEDTKCQETSVPSK